jgi:hypothetical protein
MKVIIRTIFETPTNGTVIIPILKTTNLADTLTQLAATLGVSAYRLITDFKAETKELLAFFVGDAYWVWVKNPRLPM